MTPLDPNHIPDDTGAAGLFGWIGESVARSLVLRLSAFVTLFGGLLGALNEYAPVWARVTSVVVGIVGAVTLLVSQLAAWPRKRQWVLMVALLLVASSLFAYHLSVR